MCVTHEVELVKGSVWVRMFRGSYGA